MKIFFAQLLCKLFSFLLRAAGRGGTNLPGRIALRVYPDLLGVLGKGVAVTLITGTNGKTTTSRIIEECFFLGGISCFSNKSGANLLTGITAAFSQHSTLRGKCRYHHAVIECDEAAFKNVSRCLNIETVVVTNVFRDQLDRYGEITHTMDCIKTGLMNCHQETVLCLNADCSLTVSLAQGMQNRVVYYGIDTSLYENAAIDLSDAAYCINCNGKYIYDYATFGHLGGFRCRECGYARPRADVAVEKIHRLGDESSEIELRIFESIYRARINLPGGYNIYNAVSAAAAATVKGIADAAIVNALDSFERSFGRAEKLELNGSDIRIMLVKNPTGYNQVLSFVVNASFGANLVLALNDRLADGTDISWIWDVDFEMLHEIKDNIRGLYVSGDRANDMALRLKYAGFPESEVRVIFDYGELISEATKDGLPVFILPTYTAMLDLRMALSKLLPMKAFYE